MLFLFVWNVSLSFVGSLKEMTCDVFKFECHGNLSLPYVSIIMKMNTRKLELSYMYNYYN